MFVYSSLFEEFRQHCFEEVTFQWQHSEARRYQEMLSW